MMHYALAHDGNFQKARRTTLRGFYAPADQYDAPTDAVVLGRNSGRTYVVKKKPGSYSDGTKAALLIVKQVADQVKGAERWRKWVFNRAAASDVDALTETIENAIDYVSEFGPRAINLSKLKATDVHCEHLASLLRATSVWQNEITGWSTALDVAKEACELAGLDSGDVLFGMI